MSRPACMPRIKLTELADTAAGCGDGLAATCR